MIALFLFTVTNDIIIPVKTKHLYLQVLVKHLDALQCGLNKSYCVDCKILLRIEGKEDRFIFVSIKN